MKNAKRRKLLGRAIRRAREEKGVSQRTLSLMLGYDSHSYMTRVENGRTPVSFDIICSIADALDTDVNYIFIYMRDAEEEERDSFL